MTWRRTLFGTDAGLFGPPLRMLRSLPTVQGRVRTGRLSVEARLQHDTSKPHQAAPHTILPPASSQVGRGNAPPPSTPPGFKRKPPPPSATGHRPKPTPHPPPMQTSAKRKSPPASTSGAGRLKPPPSSTSMLTRRRGLGDVDTPPPFNPNAEVWILAQEVPLLGQFDGNAASRQNAQLHYPDGSPAFARYWLPKANLNAVNFSPVIPGSTWQDAGDPRARNPNEEGGAGWNGPQGDDYVWEFIVDYDCGEHDQLALPSGSGHAAFMNTVWSDKVDHACRGIMDWDGETKFVYHYVASFDWSTVPPDRRAPMWLWLNFFDPGDGMQWIASPAELYRADRQTIEVAGEPDELPGRAWLDLNFIDAIHTGAHGMPIMVAPDGRLDDAAFAQFLRDHPDWSTILGFGRRNNAMLAIINDMGARAGGSVDIQPPAPPSHDRHDSPSSGDDDLLNMWRHQPGGAPQPPDDSSNPAPPDDKSGPDSAPPYDVFGDDQGNPFGVGYPTSPGPGGGGGLSQEQELELLLMLLLSGDGGDANASPAGDDTGDGFDDVDEGGDETTGDDTGSDGPLITLTQGQLDELLAAAAGGE